MGKRLIINGASFGANGISVPDYELVDAVEWLDVNNFANNYISIVKNSYRSTGFLAATHVEVVVENWPSSVAMGLFTSITKDDGTFKTLTGSIQNNIIKSINTSNLPSQANVTSGKVNMILQSTGTYTAEQQEAITAAHVKITVNFYHLNS